MNRLHVASHGFIEKRQDLKFSVLDLNSNSIFLGGRGGSSLAGKQQQHFLIIVFVNPSLLVF